MTPRIQETHLIIGHTIVEMLDMKLFGSVYVTITKTSTGNQNMSDLKEQLELKPQDLTWATPPEGLISGTTASIEAPEDIVGQDRAIKAIKRGLAMEGHGYNIFVSGTNGQRLHRTLKKLYENSMSADPVPDDLCYVNNFKDSDHPRLIVLPAGQGTAFRDQGRELIISLKKRSRLSLKVKSFKTARNEIVNRHMGAQKAPV